jgi:drug/metabolite transporter (DMT)-like permease
MTPATLLLFPVIRSETKRGEKRDWRGSDILVFLLLAVVGMFPGQVLITWGTRMSLASNAALLMLTLPVSTAFLAFIFLHEKMTVIRWISFALVIIGVLMCSDIDFRSLNFGRSYLLGNFLIFVGLWGVHFITPIARRSWNDTRLQ